ncbi:LCP family protein [Clostridium massiliodielmoense]|uniref:LCP family protein n=1 Tax=Clostridium massiliodielmoense TaxID=1776385 RepID=UPI001FA6B038|nr:LCP family protein [Clostridium massiliodielmoense]
MKSLAKHEKKKNGKKVILSIFVIFIIIAMGVCGYLYWGFRSNTYVKNYGNDEDGNYEEVDGISNILLIGNDARNLDERSRSDAILILSIDNINKKLKLVSIMRDSYVDIPGYGEQKINHAFAYGGAELLKDTIEKNFNLKLHDYGIINFNGFQELVNSIGGLDVDVSEKERVEMNKFIPEVNPKDPHLVKKAGIQHLDGQQVLSYSRIRKIGNGDYDRTERQREVISLIIDKLKDTNVLKYPMLASKLFPYVKTNMDITGILNYAYTIYKVGNYKPEQMLIPVPEITSPRVLGDKGWVVLMDVKQNAQIMHDFIFEDKMYISSSLDYDSFKRAIEQYKSDINNSTKPTNNKQDIFVREEERDAYESKIDINNKEIKKQINKYKYKNNINKKNHNISKNSSAINNKSDIKNKKIKVKNKSKNDIKNNLKTKDDEIIDNNIKKEDILKNKDNEKDKHDKKEEYEENVKINKDNN